MSRKGLAWCHTAEERFWKQTSKQSSRKCWNWLGSLRGRDCRATLRVDGRSVYAYRYSWILHYGPIPANLCVLHRCDNPRCVNPNHLFLGTHSVNMLDAFSKGRKTTVGTKNPRVKLTEDQVKEIRRRYPLESGTKLAKEFGIDRTAPFRIYNRIVWGHVS